MNNSENTPGCINTIIAIIMVLSFGIVYPLFFIIEILSAPSSIQILTLIWIGIVFFSILLGKETRIILFNVIFFTLVYSFIFSWGYTNDDSSILNNDNFMKFIAAVCTTLPLGGISYLIRSFVNNEKGIIRINRANHIKSKIESINCEIKQLEQKLSTKRTILNLLKLMNYCGADISNIEHNSNVSNIKQLNDEIALKKKEIKKLSDKLMLHIKN